MVFRKKHFYRRKTLIAVFADLILSERETQFAAIRAGILIGMPSLRIQKGTCVRWQTLSLDHEENVRHIRLGCEKCVQGDLEIVPQDLNACILASLDWFITRVHHRPNLSFGLEIGCGGGACPSHGILPSPRHTTRTPRKGVEYRKIMFGRIPTVKIGQFSTFFFPTQTSRENRICIKKFYT